MLDYKYGLLVVLATGCIIFLMCFLHGFAGVDDTHITYAAVQQFLSYGAILNHNSVNVEQGSSLLHVCLLAFAYVLSSVDLPVLGPVVSIVFSVCTFCMAILLAKKVGVRQPGWVVVLLALSLSFNYWSIVGLETSLIAFIVTFYAWALICFLTSAGKSELAVLFIASALFNLARPEGIFILMAIIFCLLCALLILRGKAGVQSLWLVVVCAIAPFVLLLFYRLNVYEQIFPQPVYAKSGDFNPLKFAAGLLYFIVSFQFSVVICSLLIGRAAKRIFWNKEQFSLASLVLISVSGSYLVFIIASGGDWMGAGRFFTPIMPVLFCWFLLQIQDAKHRSVYLTLMLISLVIETTYFGLKHSKGFTVFDRGHVTHQFQGESLGDYSYFESLSQPHLRDIPLIAYLNQIIESSNMESLSVMSVQMGMVPYYIGRRFGRSVSFIDMRGLTTKDITACDAFYRVALNGSGTLVKYSEYFSVLGQGRCHLESPDIIYDLSGDSSDRQRLNDVKNQGFKLLYRQTGKIKDARGNKAFNVDAFIAVSPDVYSRLPAHLKKLKERFF